MAAPPGQLGVHAVGGARGFKIQRAHVHGHRCTSGRLGVGAHLDGHLGGGAGGGAKGGVCARVGWGGAGKGGHGEGLACGALHPGQSPWKRVRRHGARPLAPCPCARRTFGHAAAAVAVAQARGHHALGNLRGNRQGGRRGRLSQRRCARTEA